MSKNQTPDTYRSIHSLYEDKAINQAKFEKHFLAVLNKVQLPRDTELEN